MSQQTINVGTIANDGTGDTLRLAGQKINSNFDELYSSSASAFNKANSADSTAQAAFDYANTIVVGEQIDSYARTTANAAFDKANTGVNIFDQELNTSNNVSFNEITSELVVANTITINAITSNTNTWNFLSNGSIKFPDDTLQTTAFTGTGLVKFVEDEIYAETGRLLLYSTEGTPSRVDIEGGQFNADVTDDINIIAGTEVEIVVNNAVSSKFFTFRTNGSIEIPGGVHELYQNKANANGVIIHDCSSGHIFYHTTPVANWTANFTNLELSTNYATSVSLVINQGSTGYYANSVQISGSAQTINWQANTLPTPSTNRVDVLTFSILYNGTTYTVLGQLTGF